MAWYEKVYQCEDEIFRPACREDMDRLMERLSDRGMIAEQNGEYYLRMDVEDILDFLEEAGELEVSDADNIMDEVWE